jgi:hypothetical protein
MHLPLLSLFPTQGIGVHQAKISGCHVEVYNFLTTHTLGYK